MTPAVAVPSVGTMTAWTPGDGGPEVLSLGDVAAPRLSTGRAVAGLLLCLGVVVLLVAHALGDTVMAPGTLAPGPVGTGGAVASVGWGRPLGSPDCALGRADHDRADCPPGRPATAGGLTGTWVRTGVTGVWRGLEGRELIRFDAGGGFTWGLRGPYRAVRGRYQLSGGTVTVRAAATSLCHAGDTYTWRATLTRAGRLLLLHVPGAERDGCSLSAEIWRGRRLENGLRAGPRHR